MNEQSCKYRFEVSVDCDKAYVVNKMDHWCWQNRVIYRVDQYCELQWDICVIERMMLSLFSDFHSLTFLKTDKPQIYSKRINHSITQSFTIGFYNHWNRDWSIDRLLCKPQNQPTNTWMDKRCSFYAVNNNNKIIIINKLVFCYKDIVYSSFFLSIICSCFYLVNAWLRDWIDAYAACYYLSRSNKQQDK